MPVGVLIVSHTRQGAGRGKLKQFLHRLPFVDKGAYVPLWLGERQGAIQSRHRSFLFSLDVQGYRLEGKYLDHVLYGARCLYCWQQTRQQPQRFLKWRVYALQGDPALPVQGNENPRPLRILGAVIDIEFALGAQSTFLYPARCPEQGLLRPTPPLQM